MAYLCKVIEDTLGNALRRLREEQHMSLRTLAENTGFSPSFISQVENGQASPSINSMERIALALGVTLGEFFSQTEQASSVVRAGGRPTLQAGWSKAKMEALGQVQARTHGIDAIMVTINAGGSSGSKPYTRPKHELALVYEGEARLTLCGEIQTLYRGDSVTIPPESPRLWQNAGTAPVVIVFISYNGG